MSKQIQLSYVMYAPCEGTDDMYMAEVPALPGCRAWGETPELALEYIESVAQAFIDSYREHGDPLPAALVAAVAQRGELTVNT